ncbi:MAG: plasmid partitioning protein RepB C-terminal domain-containing protein [Parvibaculaceae bacterium]
MSKAPAVPAVMLIPIDRITVVNPRVRNKRIFREIISNIERLGLKKPITVSRREHPDGPGYDLVCGQGRLEAYQALGQQEIPAIVIDADSEDCLVMSLVENCARRQHRAVDLLRDIEGLKRRGYTDTEIARKTDLSNEYVRGIVGLLWKGELRLLRAVESGQIPLSVAVEIAEADDAGTQRALQTAYETKALRGRKLLIAKRIVEQRRRRGKGLRVNSTKRQTSMSADALVRAYNADIDKKRLIIRKADANRDRLMFVTEAFRSLMADENFVTLLRAEGLDTFPRQLADRLAAGRHA